MRQSEFIDDLGGVKPIPDNARKVFGDGFHDVWQWQQELYDGGQAAWERLSRADSVQAVGILPDRQILLISDEQPDRGPVITAAGGAVDEGESPEDATKREYLEETGYEVGELVPWFHYRVSTKVEWTAYCFVARDLKRIHEEAETEPGEKIELKIYSFDEFLDLGKSLKLRDRLMRWMLCMALLDNKKREEIEKIFYE